MSFATFPKSPLNLFEQSKRVQTIEINKGVSVAFNDLLKGIQNLDSPTLKKLIQELDNIVSKRESQKPSDREKELLEKIKSTIPASIKREEKRLYKKMEKGTITKKEHEELLFLLDFMENKAADRIQLMGELAALRGVPLSELAQQFSPNQ